MSVLYIPIPASYCGMDASQSRNQASRKHRFYYLMMSFNDTMYHKPKTIE